jgi:hypothetical protein
VPPTWSASPLKCSPTSRNSRRRPSSIEALQHAARAESEPSFALAPWIRRFLQDKDLMEKVARRDNRELVDGRLVIPRLPRAA